MRQNPEPSIFTRLSDAGIETDSHESDLYVLDTAESRSIIEAFEAEGGLTNRTPFKGSDGRDWIDIPFSYDPFWQAKGPGR